LETDVAQPFQTVYDKKNRPVRARTLLDAAGQPIVDPKTGRPLIVDYDLDMDAAMAFGRSLKDLPLKEKLDRMEQAFVRGGPLDMQRSYNKKVGGGVDEFVGAFTPGASFLLGVVGREANLPADLIVKGGGLYNLCAKFDCDHLKRLDIQNWKWNPDIDTSGPFFNNPENARWINEGIKVHDSGRFFKRSPMNDQGDGATQAAAAQGNAVISSRSDDWIVPGQQSPTPQDQLQNPLEFGVADPQAPNRQSAWSGQAGGAQQLTSPTSPGLPQPVIDAGNYLRANGFEITPRSMYVASVLGPQRAVDLFNRTGSTSSGEVPSPDAATGRQVLSWVRALRLGSTASGSPPAAPNFDRSAAPSPAAQAFWGNVGEVPQDNVSEDAGMPAYGPA
jgi:hypothetical protein